MVCALFYAGMHIYDTGADCSLPVERLPAYNLGSSAFGGVTE